MTIESKESPDSPGEERGVGTETRAEAVAGEEAATPDVEGELRAELAATKDRLLRALADLDNQRKRMDRERRELRATWTAAPLREFLGVIDNLDRALGAEASADDLRAGVEMIRRQMTDLLRRFDVVQVESLNAPFDPNLHEAVAREESADVEEATVVQELLTGYTMESRLLRAAMVRVAVPASPAAPADAGGEDGAAAGGGA